MADQTQRPDDTEGHRVRTLRSELPSRARHKRADAAQRTADAESREREREEQRAARTREARLDRQTAGIESESDIRGLPHAMSWDEWNAAGPLFRERESTDPDKIYDGTTRERLNTPNWPHISGGGLRKTLGNPNRSAGLDSFTLAQSQYTHLVNMIDQGGNKFVSLVRTAAKAGAEVREQAKTRTGNADNWTMLATDAREAQILRHFIDAALEQFPPGQGPISQKLPSREEDIDRIALRKQFDARVEPRRTSFRFRRRILDEDGVSRFSVPDASEARIDKALARPTARLSFKMKPTEYAGQIAVFADRGFEDMAGRYVAQNGDSRLLFAPEKNPALVKAMMEHRPKGRYYPQLHDPKAKGNAVTDQILSRSDGAFFFWNGDEKSYTFAAFAEAFRQGKALRIFDPEGQELNILKTGREACKHHMSKREFALSKDSEVHDIDLGTPEASLALSLVNSRVGEDKRIQSIPQKDIARLSSLDGTISDIVALARDEEGRETLDKTHRLTPETIRLLGDADAMSRARQSYKMISQDMARHDITLVGPRDYPESLVRALPTGLMPTHLFAQGNTDLLREAGPIIGLAGTPPAQMNDQDRGIFARRAQTFIDGLAKQDGVTLAVISGQEPTQMPERPRITVSSSGAAHLTDKEEASNGTTLATGGVVLFTQPPSARSYHYDAKAINPETGRKGAIVPTSESRGDPIQDRKAMDIVAAVSDTVVITDFDPRESKPLQARAVETSLRIGRLPVAINHGDYPGFDRARGAQALLGQTGQEALLRAGLPTQAAERLGETYKGRKPAIDSGRDLERASVNLVRHLKGQPLDLPQRKPQQRDHALEA